MKRYFGILFTLPILAIFVYAAQVRAEPAQQIMPTSTPVQVSLPTQLPIGPTPTDASNPNVSITRTPTPEGAALLEAITEANVRSQPDPDSDRLGTIRSGETYTIIGRYYKWYEFQYNQSPSGVGWVFDELVNISGNANRIPDLTLGTPTANANDNQSVSTLVILTQTPGGILTATAGVGVIPLPDEAQVGGVNTQNNPVSGTLTPLPTYTFPPELSGATGSNQEAGVTASGIATPGSTQRTGVELPTKIPPILPILLLGGGGLLGLLVSSIRK